MIRLLLTVILALAGVARAQEGATLIVRLVAPDGRIPDGGWARISPGSLTDLCESKGEISFSNLPAGRFRIEAGADGYATVDSVLDMCTGATANVTIRLSERLLNLEGSTIVGLRSNSTVRVYERQEIERSGAQSLSEFLQRTAGVDVRDDGSADGSGRISVGGSAPNQLLFIVDGRRALQTGSGEVEISAVPLTRIESVEVLRGASVDLGGEAIGGIVSVETRRDPGVETGAQGRMTDTHWEYEFSRRARIRTIQSFVQYRRVMGPGDFRYSIADEDELPESTGTEARRANNWIDRDQWYVKLSGGVASSTPWDFSASLDDHKRGLPGYLSPFLTPQAKQSTRDLSLNGRLSTVTRGLLLSSRLSLDANRRQFENPDSLSLQKSSFERGETFSGECRASGKLSRLKVAGGFQAAQELLRGEALLGGAASRQRNSLWATFTKTIARQSTTLSLTQGGGMRIERYGDTWLGLPEATVSIVKSGTQSAILLLRVGRSYRAPSMYELFWADDLLAQGNPDIRPELSDDAIATLSLNGLTGEGSLFDATGALQEVTDLIFWQRTVDNRFKPQNLTRARVATLSVSARQPVGFGFTLQAGSDWNEVRNDTDDRNTGGKVLPYRTPRSHRAALHYNGARVFGAASWRWRDARPVTDANTKWLSSYQVVDVQIGYAHRMNSVELSGSVGVNNALNESYRLVRFAPLPLRTVYFSLSIKSNQEVR